MNTNQPLKKFNWISLLAGGALLVSVLSSPVARVQAQYGGWSFPQTIPSFDLNNAPPILVPDQDGNIHAFSSQYVDIQEGGKIRVIVYNKWTLEAGWTPPVDIIVSPIKEARVTDVYLDEEGFVHLVFFGGDGTSADIYYSQARLDAVGSARSWSKPFIIGDNAGDPEGAVITANRHGALIVAFTGRQYGIGVYVIRSEDRGNTWSFPTPIFITDGRAPNIDFLDILVGKSASSHIVWNVFSVDGQGRGIYYTKSLDGVTWDQPSLLASTPEGLGVRDLTIFEYQNTLFAIYVLPPKFIMRLSSDDGKTWTDPAIIFPRHVGANGAASLVIGGDNRLHLFFGQRISGSPDIHGMWHTTWANNRWTEPDAVVKGPQVNDLVGDTSFDPNEAAAVVSRGNVILLTWRTDPGLKGNGVWYSYKILDVPESPVKLPTSETLPNGTLSPSSTGIMNLDDVPTQIPVDNSSTLTEQNPSSAERKPGSIITLGVIPAIALLLAVMILWRIRRKSL